MDTVNNGHSTVEHAEAVLEELRSKKSGLEEALRTTTTQISAAEMLLATLGPPSGFVALPDQAEGYQITHAAPASLRGLSNKEAVIAYARSLPDGIFRMTEAAIKMVADGVGGYKTNQQANAAMWFHINKDPRFTKLRRGVYGFKETLSGPGITQRLERAKQFK